MMKFNRLSAYTWGVLIFTICVILWGAFVRATGSGAGCGNHWPSCQGEVIPWSPKSETLIEFVHRMSSGLSFFLITGLLVWAYKNYPKGHRVRLGALLSMVFILIETLVGAGLVLFELVAYNDSIARSVVVPIHLVNTFLLLTALTLTVWWVSGGPPIQLKGHGRWGWAWGLAYTGMLLLAASGGITALGDTLFPVKSLAEGLQQDFSPTAHILIRLRLYHPLIAILLGAYIIVIAGIFNLSHPAANTKRFTRIFTVAYLVQLGLGIINVALLAPVWVQLIHLLVSDILLIVLVLLMSTAFSQPVTDKRSVEISSPSAKQRVANQPSG